MSRSRVAVLALLLASCGGEGECAPLAASGDGLSVTLTQEGGCGGGAWMATVTFDGGRTQTVAGDRDGPVLQVLVGDVSGDGTADLVVAAETDRVFAFVRQGGVLFGRELPPAPGAGPVVIGEGQLRRGTRVWDPATGQWSGS